MFFLTFLFLGICVFELNFTSFKFYGDFAYFAFASESIYAHINKNL